MTTAVPVRVLPILVVLASAFAMGQGTCVPDPVEVDQVEGVVRFEAGLESTPLPDATVAISHYDEPDAPVASTVSGDDGHFSISYTTPGRYWLSVRHKALIGFSTELRLRSRYSHATRFLIATIRNDPNKPCGGGLIQLSPVLTEACRFLEYQNQNFIDYGPLKLRQVKGIAEDDWASPVPDTCLGIFSEPGHQLVSILETDGNGRFEFGPAKPGRYRLVASQAGFGIANVLLDVGSWPSGGVVGNRALTIHMRPRGLDYTSFVDWKSHGN